MSFARIVRAIDYFKNYGLVSALKRSYAKVGQKLSWAASASERYASTEQLEQWSLEQFDYQPKFSILVPMYRTPLNFFQELLESIQGQVYANWELCLADGSETATEAGALAEKMALVDSRIKYQRLPENKGISGNTNAALEMASGDYIVLCDHDDLLALDALYHVTKALNEDPSIDICYTDEDKIGSNSKKHFDPNFKPDFNLDFFRCGNYICHMFVVRRQIAQSVGFKREYDGAQDFDFILRCVEQTNKVCHIPRLLYFWRCHELSTAANSDSKPYAYLAGMRAANDHIKRCQIKASVILREDMLGYYDISYEQQGQPLVSVVSTTALSQEVCEQIKASYSNVQLVLIEGAYEPAEINKAVSAEARGEFVLFVDPRVQWLNPEALPSLLAPLQRQDLASTFAKVYGADKRIYSAGMIMGVGGAMSRFASNLMEHDEGYQKRLKMHQNFLASDLSCALIRHSSFVEVGGMEEGFGLEASAVDLFLKLGQTGKLHLFEHKAQARINAVARVSNEWLAADSTTDSDLARFCEKWPNITSAIDPNYNPNLLYFHPRMC